MRHLVGLGGGGGGGGGGGELAKEVDFAFMFLLLFLANLFCEVQWLASFLFFFLNCYTIQFILFNNCTHYFCVLPNLWFEKLKLCPILLMLNWFHA